MDQALQIIEKEVVDLHVFFTQWFNGTVEREALAPRFLSHMADDLVFITPEGHVMGHDHLRLGFEQTYGTNPEFKIEIRDVKILQKLGTKALVKYTEWQKGAKLSAQAQNARISTGLIDISASPTWHHLHETWLPQDIVKADPFTF